MQAGCGRQSAAQPQLEAGRQAKLAAPALTLTWPRASCQTTAGRRSASNWRRLSNGNGPARKIARSVHEAARDKARAIAKTEAYAVSRRERKKVEMLFAHLKRILRLDRLRLRGPSGAKDEFLLAATAQNLRKLAKLIPFPAPIFAT